MEEGVRKGGKTLDLARQGGAAHGSNHDWKVHQEGKCDSPKQIKYPSMSLQQVATLSFTQMVQ